jgi:putative ubiquitin-RnfH superfamily antitoxin RatB of RatAB toxin-antitoxin module
VSGCGEPAQIDCELVADHAPRPRRIRLQLPAGATVIDAVRAARAAWGEAALDWQALQPGVWGEEARPDRPLCGGDRVELYRALPNDPRAARRARAAGRRGGP